MTNAQNTESRSAFKNYRSDTLKKSSLAGEGKPGGPSRTLSFIFGQRPAIGQSYNSSAYAIAILCCMHLGRGRDDIKSFMTRLPQVVPDPHFWAHLTILAEGDYDGSSARWEAAVQHIRSRFC